MIRETGMKNLFFLLALFVIVVIQATVLDYLRVFGVKPDLLIGFAVIISVYSDLRWALFFSILAGLFKDLLGSSGFGINIFLLPLWSYLIWKLSRKISIDDTIGISVTAFLTVLVNDIASHMLYIYLGKYVSLGIFLRIMLIGSLYTALALPFFVQAFVRINTMPCWHPDAPDLKNSDSTG
jgi:rod shape-determining protein MreD